MRSYLIVPTLVAAITRFARTASAEEFNGTSAGVGLAWNKSSVCDPATDIGAANIDRPRDFFLEGVFVGYDQEILAGVVIDA